MIRFFRKIRQQLWTQNKFSKYALYALGEIILVVIGILIALQVNNWNESRKDLKSEQLIVQTIYDELEENLQYNTSIRTQIETRISATMTLMGYTAASERQITARAFDSVLVRAFLFPPYTPADADLKRVLGSSQIDLVRSQTLQEGFSDYKTSIDMANLYYKYAEDDFKLTILPYFIKNYPLMAMLSSYGLQVPSTAHKRNYEELLASREFENILSVIFADSGGQLQAVINNIERIESLKQLIESEYKLEITD